jgi:hypothetical protein
LLKGTGLMDIDLGDLNYLAVVAGIIINMALGALWYSPILFANSWMAATGITKEYIDEHKDQAMKGYAVSIVASIVFVLGLAVMVQVSGAADLAEGLAIGLIAGVGFVATTQGANYTFENRPLKLYLINIGYSVVGFAIIGALLGAWD